MYYIYIEREREKEGERVHHNLCFNLFLLHNNSFDNQGSEINKSNIFYVSAYCLLQKLSSYSFFLYIHKKTTSKIQKLSLTSC